MKGNREIISAMNTLLTAELTAIDFYFVHSRVLDDLGYSKLYEQFKHEMEDEKEHVAKIIERLIFLEGTPEVGARLPFKVTKDVHKMLADDLDAEKNVRQLLIDCIDLCFLHKDYGTKEALEPLLKDTEEDHIDWLEMQLGIINDVGIERYLAEKL